jgi:hypothetical protein
MIDGHGDDSYKYSRPITANFSSNVYSKVNLSRLKENTSIIFFLLKSIINRYSKKKFYEKS